MADKYNITIEKGATYRENVQWLDDNGLPIDLTGYTARMQIRRTYNATILVELTTENSGITITPLTGELDLFISANDTGLFSYGSFIYDLELINGSEVVRLIEGNVEVKENVTK